MAARTMKDDLNVAVADNNQTLTVSPQVELIERGFKNQQIVYGVDGSRQALTLGSGENTIFVSLRWASVPEADSGTILLFYYDSAYGFGIGETFYWEHPTDGNTYVVHFTSDIRRTIRHTDNALSGVVVLGVVGWKA